MKISSYTGGMVQTNAYLIETPDGNVLIDAPDGVAEWLDAKGVRVDVLLLTHQHYDHVEGVADLQAKGVKVWAWDDYSTDLTLENHARNWGLPIRVKPYRVDRRVAEGPLEVAGMEFRVSHVPGHATDGVTFHLPAEEALFSGDTLFAGSIGRPDLPGGNEELLLAGIEGKLFGLPEETRVFCGHGPATTIGYERENNPYLV
jgi:glyoxylase-like metal-dependent hydrolase (beta-lactamase superfamily II)